MEKLPAGWTVERIRAMGVSDVCLVEQDIGVLEHGVDDLLELEPEVIINCGGLYLVLDRGDGEWHMGQMDGDETIVCWASYGADLERAIRAL